MENKSWEAIPDFDSGRGRIYFWNLLSSSGKCTLKNKRTKQVSGVLASYLRMTDVQSWKKESAWIMHSGWYNYEVILKNKTAGLRYMTVTTCWMYCIFIYNSKTNFVYTSLWTFPEFHNIAFRIILNPNFTLHTTAVLVDSAINQSWIYLTEKKKLIIVVLKNDP